ncbi:diguanylate cyclase [Neiella marina]|uniref:Diguanylate cyclase n=1 Tax=Neiella holothuriorum TaxID=2870530 RepID=A0ABS7EJB4_9GAMM|nr:diguanylate cyclase [Neiella holothuriorum]MBW8191861.1 diguanylate cyclase [Neiella holothuriorum]
MIFYQFIQYQRFLTRYHSQRLMAALVGALILAAATIQVGSFKTVIRWLDVAGEGAAALLALSWLLLLLCARPPGKITNLLYSGALLYWFACLLDLMDEFIHYPMNFRLFADLESLAIPTAMLLVTLGLWEWLKEQKLINRQLKQRELVHRDYQLLDPLTQLYGEAYLVQQLQGIAQRKQPEHCELIMFELQVFGGDTPSPNHDIVCQQQLLGQFAELMLAMIHTEDVLCRCGGQRFALLLTNVTSCQANVQFQRIIETVQARLPANICRVQRSWSGAQPAAEFIANTEQELQQRVQSCQPNGYTSRDSGLC